MCQQYPEKAKLSSSPASGAARSDDHPAIPMEDFPWDLGVFDAHCHPTDTMDLVATIPGMKTRVLTIMSTRQQDQDLVTKVSSELGVKTMDAGLALNNPHEGRILPSFGWHPWFSYQFYDDLVPSPTYDGTTPGKVAHYDKVLTPPPSTKDVSFSEGLPEPRPLSEFLRETKARLEQHPFALVGEVGVDKAFRLPQSWTATDRTKRDPGLTPGGREGRQLSPHRVQVSHQIAILQAQLRLAGEMGRAVSVHGVQAHGILHDTMARCWKGHEKEVLSRRQKRQIAEGTERSDSDSDDAKARAAVGRGADPVRRRSGIRKPKPKPFPPRICLHSFSGPVGVLKQYTDPAVPAKIFFSFSIAINWGAGGGEKTEEAIKAVPDDRILVESDLHRAGDQMDQSLEEVCRKVCEVKGWSLRDGVDRLGRNWREFAFG
ncbi:hydrolase [Xylariaceae sp. FL0804]|nr:hydrolase [Xylariaceae sp. FL0804]